MAAPDQTPVLHKAIRVLRVIADGSCVTASTSLARSLRTAPASCWACQSPADVMESIHQARQHGLAEDHGSFRPDVFGLNAPPQDRERQIQGAITLTGLFHGLSEKQIRSLRSLIPKDAARINSGFSTEASSRK